MSDSELDRQLGDLPSPRSPAELGRKDTVLRQGACAPVHPLTTAVLDVRPGRRGYCRCCSVYHGARAGSSMVSAPKEESIVVTARKMAADTEEVEAEEAEAFAAERSMPQLSAVRCYSKKPPQPVPTWPPGP